jgi:hypothetical protein
MSKLSDLKKPLGATTSSNSYVHFPTGHEDLVHDVAYGIYPSYLSFDTTLSLLLPR